MVLCSRRSLIYQFPESSLAESFRTVFQVITPAITKTVVHKSRGPEGRQYPIGSRNKNLATTCAHVDPLPNPESNVWTASRPYEAVVTTGHKFADGELNCVAAYLIRIKFLEAKRIVRYRVKSSSRTPTKFTKGVDYCFYHLFETSISGSCHHNAKL